MGQVLSRAEVCLKASKKRPVFAPSKGREYTEGGSQGAVIARGGVRQTAQT